MDTALGAEFLKHFHEEDGFCYPDWSSIVELADMAVPEEAQQALWEELGRHWLGRLRAKLGGSYRVIESDNFLILTAAPDRIVADAGRFYERALREIHARLEGVSSEERMGKYEVILFENLDDYYAYTTRFYDGDDLPMSGGVFLTSGGCSHFAIPVFEYTSYRSVLVHELTHGCLAHLDLPLWLNEAIAMRMEGVLGGTGALQVSAEEATKHRRYWDARTIQQFWSGESWSVPGDSFGLSYELAQVILHLIEADLRPERADLLEFIGTARSGDGGDEACQTVFGLGLGDVAACFLGAGRWEPRPEEWATREVAEGTEGEGESN